jgi:hypothetical protein
LRRTRDGKGRKRRRSNEKKGIGDEHEAREDESDDERPPRKLRVTGVAGSHWKARDRLVQTLSGLRRSEEGNVLAMANETSMMAP